MTSKYSSKPARDHSGETYGAIKVGNLRQQTNRTFTYDITWICCDTKSTMNQKDLNVRRGNMPGQCIACRRAGKMPMPLVENSGASDRASADIITVDSPWGMVQGLFGWSPEARINRPWASE